MTTTIKIWDCGCGVEISVERGVMQVVSSGGCPVEQILGRVRLFADRERTAKAVLRKWMRGYDGGRRAAVENSLYVEVYVEVADENGSGRVYA